jgi:hypothetical protein
MEDRGRIVRLNPATGVPHHERYSQMERVIDALWDSARELGISLGAKPTMILTGDAISPPSTLLARLTTLETEVLATFIMVGIGDAHARAVHALATTPPGKPSPNYRTIIEDVFNQDVESSQEVGQD